MKQILVTTTSSLEGWEITQYIKPVSAHLVIGTNVFSDFFASFSDFFGGTSSTYQNKLNGLYVDAIKKIQESAFALGANGVIGLNIDFDEISGKGKSMFMLTAVGTAVIIRRMGGNTDNSKLADNTAIPVEQLINLRIQKSLLNKMNQSDFRLSDSDWNFIIENRVDGLFDILLTKQRSMMVLESDTLDGFINKLKVYIDVLPYDKKVSLLYSAIVNEKDEKILNGLNKIVQQLRLMDIDNINFYLTHDNFNYSKRILRAVIADKKYYTKDDIEKLHHQKDIILKRFPERGERSSKKQLFSSKEKEVWNCECGKQNSEDYCSSCGSDIYGFKRNDVHFSDAINHMDYKIKLLKECFKQQAEELLENR